MGHIELTACLISASVDLSESIGFNLSMNNWQKEQETLSASWIFFDEAKIINAFLYMLCYINIYIYIYIYNTNEDQTFCYLHLSDDVHNDSSYKGKLQNINNQINK